jgi:quinol monooxygenase YgiN
MSKISVIAKLTAAEGKTKDLEGVLRSVVEAAEEEAGLEIYSVHAVKDEPDVFYFFELYQTDDAFAVHGRGDGMSTAMAAFKGLLAGRPEVTMMTPVVAKGLEI